MISTFKSVAAVGEEYLIDISVSTGLITNIEDSRESDSNRTQVTRVFPGLIDVHIHGAVGVDVNAADVGSLVEIAGFLGRNGVTGWVPTLVPDSDENYRRVIGEIDRLMEVQEGRPIAQAVGVHYEGVFANEKMCGALRPEYFKRFTGKELDELPRLKRGVHMTTFAPEVDTIFSRQSEGWARESVPGAIATGSGAGRGITTPLAEAAATPPKTGGELRTPTQNSLAAELARQGWIASIGHTRADFETLERAFADGARHMTHFFNAMTGVHHRDVGVAGWGLSNRDVTFDIIADGVHVHPSMLELACRAKTADKVTLISDSVAPTGLGDGEFEIWGEKISVENRRTRNERGSIAGSVITMHDAFLRMRSLGFSDAELAKMSSGNPARLLGLSDSRGSIEVGKRADLVGIRQDGSIEFVMIGGEMVDMG